MHLLETELQTKSANPQSDINAFAASADPRGDRVEFRTIRDLQELDSFRPLWKSWRGTRESDLDFFSSTLRSSANGCLPHVIVLFRNSQPEALLVGRSESRKLAFKLGYFTLCERPVKIIDFVHGCIRGNASAENCTYFTREVMRSLADGEADLAAWDQLDLDSPLYRRLLRVPGFAQRDHARCLKHRWLMTFPDGLDAFLMSLGRSQRSKLRRKYKKILTRFADRVRIQCCRSLDELALAIAEMEEVASKTEKRRFGFGFMDSLKARDQLLTAAQNGWLRVYLLHLDGKPIAFWMGTLYGRCLRADHVAYDPSFRDLSPGIFLFLSILEDLRDEDIESIDLGRGNTQFRECFCDLKRLESRIHIYAPSARGYQLNLLHTVVHHINACLVAFLRHVRCLEWVKKTWRSLILRRGNGGSCGRETASTMSSTALEAESLEFGE